jgi:hypothetical protein
MSLTPSNAVTLVMVETEHHDLARITLEHWTRRMRFAEVITFSDQPLIKGATHVPIAPLEDERAYAELLIHSVWPFVKTEHTIHLSWDTLLRDQGNWDSNFFNYDYIGQMFPWQAPRANNMDHCGISWRSAKMLQAMRYPTVEPVFDDTPDYHSINVQNVLRNKFKLVYGDLPTYRKLCLEYDYNDDHQSFAVRGIANIIDTLDRSVSEQYVIKCPQSVTDDLRSMHYIVASLVNRRWLELLEYLAPKIKAGPAHADLVSWISQENFEGRDSVLDILE